MQILVLLGMCFDAVVLFVTSQKLFFRLALAILWFRSSFCKLIYNYQNHDFDHPRLEEDFNAEQFLGHWILQ